MYFSRIYFSRGVPLIDRRSPCAPRVLVLVDRTVPEGYEVLTQLVDTQGCLPIKYCLLRVGEKGSENIVAAAARQIGKIGFTFDPKFHIVNALIPKQLQKVFHFNAYTLTENCNSIASAVSCHNSTTSFYVDATLKTMKYVLGNGQTSHVIKDRNSNNSHDSDSHGSMSESKSKSRSEEFTQDEHPKWGHPSTNDSHGGDDSSSDSDYEQYFE